MPPKKPAAAAAKGGAKKAPAKAAAGKGAAAKAAPKAAPKEEKKVEEAPLMGSTIGLKQIATYFNLPENELGKSGRWALLIDVSARCATFLRHRDCNMLNVMSPSDMEPERVRMGLLGSIRFGKPFVFDCMEADLDQMWGRVTEKLEAVQAGLTDKLLDKSILKEDNYMTLVTAAEGDEYKSYNFDERFTSQFSFILLTNNAEYPKDLARKFFTVVVE